MEDSIHYVCPTKSAGIPSVNLAQLAQQEAGKRHVAGQTTDDRSGRGQVLH
jgi:hypothetical protein